MSVRVCFPLASFRIYVPFVARGANETTCFSMHISFMLRRTSWSSSYLLLWALQSVMSESKVSPPDNQGTIYCIIIFYQDPMLVPTCFLLIFIDCHPHCFNIYKIRLIYIGIEFYFPCFLFILNREANEHEALVMASDNCRSWMPGVLFITELLATGKESN